MVFLIHRCALQGSSSLPSLYGTECKSRLDSGPSSALLVSLPRFIHTQKPLSRCLTSPHDGLNTSMWTWWDLWLLRTASFTYSPSWIDFPVGQKPFPWVIATTSASCATPKEELGCSSAEMVYGTPLTVAGDFLPSLADMHDDTALCLRQLRDQVPCFHISMGHTFWRTTKYTYHPTEDHSSHHNSGFLFPSC